jgi:hypothetical protein
MTEKLSALLAMFAFGLACGMMLRDWQTGRRLAREQEARLRSDYGLTGTGKIPNMPSIPPPPPRSSRRNPAS